MCSRSLFVFTAAHFHLGAASIFRFLTTAITVSCFLSDEIRLLCFSSLTLSLSLLSTSVQTFKIQSKRLGFAVVFSLRKFRQPCKLPPKRAGASPRLTRRGGPMDVRTYVRFCQNQTFLDAQITKFSYPWYSAGRAARARELRYK